MKLRVTSIQRGCVYDGPGVRTTVFLKGCTMRCPWCCNPETISMEEEYFIDDSKCLLRNGVESKLCENCERRGGSSTVSDCPFGVSEPVSKDYTAEGLYDLLSRDFELMLSSGGGVTFSGGEPLLQIDALLPLLAKLKSEGIHIAFETTLTTSDESIRKAADFANLLIIDLKLQPEHPLYRNQQYLTNLSKRISRCRNRSVNLRFRLVFVDSMIEASDEILELLKVNCIISLELLKCHNLGHNKYKKLGIDVEKIAVSDLFQKFSTVLQNHSIIVKNLSI